MLPFLYYFTHFPCKAPWMALCLNGAIAISLPLPIEHWSQHCLFRALVGQRHSRQKCLIEFLQPDKRLSQWCWTHSEFSIGCDFPSNIACGNARGRGWSWTRIKYSQLPLISSGAESVVKHSAASVLTVHKGPDSEWTWLVCRWVFYIKEVLFSGGNQLIASGDRPYWESPISEQKSKTHNRANNVGR